VEPVAIRKVRAFVPDQGLVEAWPVHEPAQDRAVAGVLGDHPVAVVERDPVARPVGGDDVAQGAERVVVEQAVIRPAPVEPVGGIVGVAARSVADEVAAPGVGECRRARRSVAVEPVGRLGAGDGAETSRLPRRVRGAEGGRSF
jgi:hypothetical protein